MSREVSYRCNICRDVVDKERLFAVRFNSNKRGDFTLLKWTARAFDEGPGIHFCFECSKRLLAELQEKAQKDKEIAHINQGSVST